MANVAALDGAYIGATGAAGISLSQSGNNPTPVLFPIVGAIPALYLPVVPPPPPPPNPTRAYGFYSS